MKKCRLNTDIFLFESLNFIETVLEDIEGLTVETTSCFVFYEPKIPKELVKLKKKKSR